MRRIQISFVVAFSLLFSACGIQKQISREAGDTVLADSAIANAHMGICIYDVAAQKYLYNYQGDKYFIPASNTKIFTCYAAMKHLGDSLVGLRYTVGPDSTLSIEPTADPSFLHPDFTNQPVYDFLKRFKSIKIFNPIFPDDFLGDGWSWNDYKDDYSAQRNNLPIYGNVIRVSDDGNSIKIVPSCMQADIGKSIDIKTGFSVDREWDNNRLSISTGKSKYTEIPFKPILADVWRMLSDTLHVTVDSASQSPNPSRFSVIHSQPTDSLLKIMMHRSDNFYAEQSLLMVSNEKLGVMNDEKIIDTLLATDFKDLPQRPHWVDGSGLSRYNLITPQDFVFVLNKMRNEVGWQRITTIFSTGGDGTLGSLYKNLNGKIFAKTGSLSNVTALSGFLITQKNRLLIFSVQVNNHSAGNSVIRKAVAKFIDKVQVEN